MWTVGGCPRLRSRPTAARHAIMRRWCAMIACPGCGARFAVADGIPAMLPRSLTHPLADDAAAVADRGLRDKVREIRARDRQASQYDSRRMLFHTLAERQALMSCLHVRPGDRVLDGGAGTGHMTLQCLGAGSEVIAVDFSRASLRILGGRIPAEQAPRLRRKCWSTCPRPRSGSARCRRQCARSNRAALSCSPPTTCRSGRGELRPAARRTTPSARVTTAARSTTAISRPRSFAGYWRAAFASSAPTA